MKKIILIHICILTSIYSYSQITKSNNTGGTLLGTSTTQTVVFNSGDFAGGCTALTDVNVKVIWSANSSVGFNFTEELALRITSPTGTTVDLVQDAYGFYTGNTSQTVTHQGSAVWGPVTTTYDDAALTSAQGRVNPENGSFKPANPLTIFNGENPSGTWSFSIADARNSGFGDSFTFTSFEITIGCGVATSAPTATTTSASSNTGSTIVVGGNVTSDGGDTVTERGVVYAVSTTDSTPEIGETGVTKVIIGNGTGAFSQTITGLMLSTLYSFRAYAINGQGVSYGAVDTFTTPANDTNFFVSTTDNNWSTITNWSLGRLPITNDNIDIGNENMILDVNNIVVNNVNIGTSGIFNVRTNNVTINGDLSNNGVFGGFSSSTVSPSIIVKGNATGDVTYNLYISTSTNPNLNWHLISPPVENQAISVASNLYLANGLNLAVATYFNNVVSNSRWYYYTTNLGPNPISTDVFVSGKGYSTKFIHLNNSLSMKGQMLTTDKTVPISDGGDEPNGNRWNLVGNPYPSSLNGSNAADAINNFLKINNTLGNLDPARGGLYLWDGTKYIEKTVDDPAFYIPPGQAFFVHAPDGGGTSVSFTEAMQTHQIQDILLRSNSISYPEIILNISNEKQNSSTKIRYIENKTTGLDPGSDVGTFTGASSNFKVFTHLVTSSEDIDFAVQALPNSNYNDMIVPIGLKAILGSEITFTASTFNLPSGLMVFLEDKETNSFIRLDEQGTSYQVTLSNDVNDTGRFYLHTSSTVLNIDNLLLDRVTVFHESESVIKIKGLPLGNVKIKLFNILGQEFRINSINSNDDTKIMIPKLPKGAYIVQIELEDLKITKKIIL